MYFFVWKVHWVLSQTSPEQCHVSFTNCVTFNQFYLLLSSSVSSVNLEYLLLFFFWRLKDRDSIKLTNSILHYGSIIHNVLNQKNLKTQRENGRIAPLFSRSFVGFFFLPLRSEDAFYIKILHLYTFLIMKLSTEFVAFLKLGSRSLLYNS